MGGRREEQTSTKFGADKVYLRENGKVFENCGRDGRPWRCGCREAWRSAFQQNERNEEDGLAMAFSEDEMRDEACFWAAVDIAGRMRDEGVVTEEEYLKVVRMLLEEFPAVIGGLFYGE